MSNLLNDKILKHVKKECRQDEAIFNFIKRILFFEAEKLKSTRYSQKYEELVDEFYIKWSGDDDI